MELSKLKLTDKRKQIVERYGFKDVEDVLSFYPFKYEEYELTPFTSFVEGRQVVFEAEIISAPSVFRKGRLSISKFKVLCEDNELLITIFNRPWIRNLHINDKVTIIGKYDGQNKVTALNYYVKDIKDVTGIIPVYSIKEGISQNEIKKLIKYTYDACKNDLVDTIPQDLIDQHRLISYEDAIRNIHFPSDKTMLAKSMSRLKYEEFLRFYVALDVLKGNSDNFTKENKAFDTNLVNKFVNSFEYELTSDQIKVKDDILKDLSSNKIMYRLLQGDVGCGKTIVAMIGLYANYLAGYQGALMAPTEILAKQHYESLKNALEPFDVRVGVLYSSMDNENVEKQKIQNGEYDVIVGTHALFSDDVEYRNLGFVIADEQHRFGVKQRKALKQKGNNCDFLLMSATPIPRTLASSIYGDMDISTIETMPKSRKGCKTYLIKKNSVIDILDDIRNKLNEGRQVYIIAAAIDSSENYRAKDVNGLYNALKDELKPYNVYLLHGKLSSVEKDEVMNRFNNNEIQVLISTTVVEVGVNVANATMMIIYDSDKFGLAQLHQLRGRIQRSSYEGTCYLLTDSKDESVIQRLNVLVDSNDGFKISYEDLKLRGPGDILGTRQSGLPAFILGNLIEDVRFVEAAKDDAHKICNNLDNPEYSKYYDNIALIASKNYVD